MLLCEGEEKLKPYIGKEFGTFLDNETLYNLKVNKGRVGQILELLIGLENTSASLDFEDGELKTNKCDINGNPKETMFITQISKKIDEILNNCPFDETHLYHKIKNMLYVPVCKDGDESQWKFLYVEHINLEYEEYKNIYKQLEDDYYEIVRQLNKHIKSSEDGFIHTSNGKFIQVRSKDSKPYNPIYSNKYGRNISNKNHAFYFKKDFMKYILSNRTSSL